MLTCDNCHRQNRDESRYCQFCGYSVNATQTQGRTVALSTQTPVAAPLAAPIPVQPARPMRAVSTGVTSRTMPKPAAPLPLDDRQTILRKATQVFGDDGGLNACLATQVMERMNQRELTYIIIDESGSMSDRIERGTTKIAGAIEASCAMVSNKFRIDRHDEIGVISFTCGARLVHPLGRLADSRQDILNSIQSLCAGGGTDINSGLVMANDNFEWHRHDVVRRAVVLTDGHGGHPLTTANQMKSAGVVIDVIGVGPSPRDVDEKLLRKVASCINGETHYRFITDRQTLVDHYTTLSGKTVTGS